MPALTRRVFLRGSAVTAFAALTAPAGDLAVSFGKADITPAPGMYLAGYAVDTPHAATGAHQPLWARCTVYWDHGRPVVVVTADVLGLPRSMSQMIRHGVQSLGVAGSDFALLATHTHTGPVLLDKLDPYIAYNISGRQMDPVLAYSSTLMSTIVTLVRDTLSAVRIPCTLDHTVTAADFSFNREGLSYRERDVPVLTARSLTGRPLAILFGYGCHPVSAGKQSLFDPDYPGAAVHRIETASEVFAQYVPGAAGDQAPTGSRGWPLRDRLGRILGDAVLQAARTPGRTLRGPIRTAYQDVDLPLDLGDLPAMRQDYTQRLAKHGLGYYRRHAEMMIDQLDRRAFATAMPVPLQSWTVGDSLRLALIGGELVSGYAAYFRARYPGIWVAAYANEVPGYIPSDGLINGGGAQYYTCGWSTDHPRIAGGAMTVYGHLGKPLSRKEGTTTMGFEQTLITAMTGLLHGVGSSQT
ncbi:hypothetical protein [Nonomuraea typhae]|uniref:hypothetical protein n=1 Tax=Nonomuraea typhae TaxID=2603600 RepID=UPI0012FAA719|nr:hypothetical protein [Nonomuraea typhae]